MLADSDSKCRPQEEENDTRNECGWKRSRPTQQARCRALSQTSHQGDNGKKRYPGGAKGPDAVNAIDTSIATGCQIRSKEENDCVDRRDKKHTQVGHGYPLRLREDAARLYS